MISRLLVTLLLAAIATDAGASGGINLSWDDCGAAGTFNRAFACITQTGPDFVLVGSFVAPPGTIAVDGAEIVMDFASADPTIPAWWQFHNAGACRQNALSASSNFTAFTSGACEDYWAGQASGGITSYLSPFQSISCRSRLTLAYSCPAVLAMLEADGEYYAFRLAITREKTVGSFTCSRCTTPMQIWLTEIKLLQPLGLGDFRITNPAYRNFVTWQGGSSTCLPVSVRKTTWGAIKSLYR